MGDKPICNWKLDANGFVAIRDMVEPEGGCTLPPGMKGWIAQETIVDEFGHPVDGDTPSLDTCSHKDTPEYKKAHAHKPTKPRLPENPEPLTDPFVKRTLKFNTSIVVPSAAKISKPADSNLAINATVMAVVAFFLFLMFKSSEDKKKKKEENDNHKTCDVKISELTTRLSLLESANNDSATSSSLSANDSSMEEHVESILKRLQKCEQVLKIRK